RRPWSATSCYGFIPPHETKCQLKIPGCTDETAALVTHEIAHPAIEPAPVHGLVDTGSGTTSCRLCRAAPLLAAGGGRVLVAAVGFRGRDRRQRVLALPARCRANARRPLLSGSSAEFRGKSAAPAWAFPGTGVLGRRQG